MPIPTYQRMQTELPEWPFSPPFAGIQSEMSASDIEKIGGFQDSENIMYLLGRARVRPGLVDLPPLPDPILGSASFFDSTGAKHQVAVTQKGLYEWISSTQTWNQITGVLTGSATDLFSFAVVGYKLCFCQGVDNIQVWDGITTTFGIVSANAYPAKFLMELNTHLVACNTVESGTNYPQRVRWSGANDPTDWTSFNAGLEDILGDLGPIYGAEKVGQQGLLLCADGVEQMIPTGLGTSPFAFLPLGSAEHGVGFPYSVAALTDLGAFYVAKDNVYGIDPGFNFNPIGSHPDNNGLQHGARTFILSELQKATVNSVFGFVSIAINGVPFLAYWLVIPGQSTWVYNISEGNWTRFTWGTKTLNIVSRFYNSKVPTWGGFQGIWATQSESWDSLNTVNPFDLVFLGFSDGSAGQLDFSSFSEQDWSIKGPQQSFADHRHVKSLERFRVGYEDLGGIEGSVAFSTENGSTDTQNFSVGTGSGLIMEVILNTKLSGVFHSWLVSGAAGVPASFTEFAPLYVPGGEFKNNP